MARQKLSDELTAYGYVFSVKKTIVTFALFFAGILVLGRFFGLERASCGVIAAAGLVMLPFFIRNSYKNRFLQRRFSSLGIYVEQFLYSFQKSGKVLVTLLDVRELFDGDPMGDLLDKVIYYINHTYTERDVERKALAMIEKEYPYPGLSAVHDFACQTEDIGGDYSGGILLLLEERRAWADRVYEQMQLKRKKRTDVALSIIVSLFLAVMVYTMAGRMGVDVSKHPVSQIVTCLVLVGDILIYYRADARLAVGYFEEDVHRMSEKEAEGAYARLKHYENTHGHHLALHALKKRLTAEVQRVFPQWLMTLSLYLQTENVQRAIFATYEGAPAVLKPPLREMIGRLRRYPSDKGAYTDFLSSLQLPEVRSAMKMLYSISEGAGGDASGQIEDIIRRNRKMEDKARGIHNDDAIAGMYVLFLAPQITGGIKLMVDMILLFSVYMERMI